VAGRGGGQRLASTSGRRHEGGGGAVLVFLFNFGYFDFFLTCVDK
jgi:hypothetical protein